MASQDKEGNSAAWEVTFEPAKTNSPRPKSPPKKRILTAEDLQKKLDVAEERRLSVEQSIKNKASREEKLKQAQAKRLELQGEFKTLAVAKLAAKDEKASAVLEQQMNEIKLKLEEHDKKVKEARERADAAVEDQSKIVDQQQREKLAKAEKLREEQMSALKEKLTEHDKHAEDVRAKKRTSSSEGKGCPQEGNGTTTTNGVH